MLPLLLKDGLLAPYVVTSTGFLLISIYLLSALDHSTEDELQLSTYRKLFFFPLKLDLGCLARWKVSEASDHKSFEPFTQSLEMLEH